MTAERTYTREEIEKARQVLEYFKEVARDNGDCHRAADLRGGAFRLEQVMAGLPQPWVTGPSGNRYRLTAGRVEVWYLNGDASHWGTCNGVVIADVPTVAKLLDQQETQK